MKKQNKIFLIVFVLIFLCFVGFWFFQKSKTTQSELENPSIQEENSDNIDYHEDWIISDSENGKFQYPDTLSANYISLVDWPPVLNVLDEPFSCLEAGEEIARAGKTEILNVDGNQYCRTTILEGAAGSVYGQYAFAFEKDGKTAILSFSLRYVQCYNYDNPSQEECLLERENFDLNNIISQIASTVEI